MLDDVHLLHAGLQGVGIEVFQIGFQQLRRFAGKLDASYHHFKIVAFSLGLFFFLTHFEIRLSDWLNACAFY